jgi:hypothetical protein
MSLLGNITRKREFQLSLVVVLSGWGLQAQSVSVVRANSYEIGGFVGESYGINELRVMGGGNVTYAVNKYILPYAEFSYFPGIGRDQSGPNYTAHFSIPIYDFHGGVHVRLPIFREKPIVPYLVFGLGVLSARETKYSVLFTNGSTLEATYPGASAFAINGGGGIRYYMTQRFGIRAEAKVYHGSGDLDNTFSKVEAGFFFQLH